MSNPSQRWPEGLASRRQRMVRRLRDARLHRSVPLALALLATLAEAAPFRLISGTTDGGGSHAQSAQYTLEGTIGQPDAGHAQGTRFRVEGGFWPAATTTPSDSIFQNSFED